MGIMQKHDIHLLLFCCCICAKHSTCEQNGYCYYRNKYLLFHGHRPFSYMEYDSIISLKNIEENASTTDKLLYVHLHGNFRWCFLVFLTYLVGFRTPKWGLLSILFILFKNFTSREPPLPSVRAFIFLL